MRFVPPRFAHLESMSAIDVGRLTEDRARVILEEIRWPDGPVCPHCGEKNATRLQGKSLKTRDGLLQCNSCRKQFTVTVNTIMHGSHITLRQWVQAFHSICSHKKGVSALQLKRNLGLHTYHSAWHLAHRIRLAMRNDPILQGLTGDVEVDETYVGGKPRDKGDNKRGRGTKKTPVLVLVERNGRAVAKPIENVGGKTLRDAIRKMVSKASRIITDEFRSYIGIGEHFDGGHATVNHSEDQFVNGDVYTNTAESFFALLKRGVTGTFHHISKRHLGRYCDEFSFRWDHRRTTDGERTVAAIQGMAGKRLLYSSMSG